MSPLVSRDVRSLDPQKFASRRLEGGLAGAVGFQQAECAAGALRDRKKVYFRLRKKSFLAEYVDDG